jgi:hypothetical protein
MGSRYVHVQFPVELLRKSELKEWICWSVLVAKNLLRANRTIGSRRTHFRNTSTGICKYIHVSFDCDLYRAFMVTLSMTTPLCRQHLNPFVRARDSHTYVE